MLKLLLWRLVMKAPISNTYITVRCDDGDSIFYGKYTVGYVVGKTADGDYYVATDDLLWVGKYDAFTGVMSVHHVELQAMDIFMSIGEWSADIEDVKTLARTKANAQPQQEYWVMFADKYPEYSFGK